MEFTKGQNVYVSSGDGRQRGFDATVTSVGSKYITVTDKYGRKYKFDKERHYCIEWCVFHLEESEESYKARIVQEEKMRFIRNNIHHIDSVLSDSEIEDIYNRLIEKFGK